MNARLYIAQRLSAAIMAPAILIHIATILYATAGGLSAAEILARTSGGILWGVFYGVFVIAAAVHAAIGMRTVMSEWTGVQARSLNVSTVVFGLALAGLGLRAVAAVVL